MTFRFVIAATMLAAFTPGSRAATFNWVRNAGGNASGTWTNQAHWSGATLPTTAADSANFASLDISSDSTVTLDGHQTINTLSFGDTSTTTAGSWLLRPGLPSTSRLTLAGSSPSITVGPLGSGKVAQIGAMLAGTNGFTKVGTGWLQLTNANAYSGTTILSGSDVRLSVGHNYAFGSSTVIVGASSGAGQVWFQPAGNRVLTNSFEIRTIRWIIDWNKAGTLDAGDLTLNGPLLLNMGGSNVRDIFCGQNLTLNGSVTITPATNPFNKQGGGTLTLNSTNTFSGPSTVHGGTLLVNGRIASPGTVTVNNGSTLGGTGRVDGVVSVLDGGTLRPGADGTGVFTCGNLNLGADANLNFAFGSTNYTHNGLIRVNGNLTLDGKLNLVNLGGFSSGTYTGLWYSGTLTDKTLTANTVPYGKTVAVQTHIPNYILFRVLNGTLSPSPGEALPMDLASPLTLSWVESPTAAAYDLYLGTSSNMVFVATTNSSGLYLGRTTALTFAAGSMLPNTTYYWRTDAVGPSGVLTKGAVLSFKTGAEIIDHMADTWVATDALNRTLPGAAQCGPLRTNRPIAIFYFTWHGENSAKGDGSNWDCSQWIAAHPYTNKYNPWADNPVFQNVPEGRAFYWAEPELGYYSPKDRWVLRKHIALLTHAGVDVLGFDFTNGHPWSMYDALIAICETIRQLRFEGFKTDIKLLFLTHADSPNTVTWLYDNFFSKGLFSDLWFRWQNKPMMLGYPDGLNSGDGTVRQEVRDFFNWRTAWAYVAPPSGRQDIPLEWQWIDTPTPQNWGSFDRADIPEQVPVACGGWANGNLGRSHTNRTQPDYDNFHLPLSNTEDQGLLFREQMHYGLKLDPEFMFVTGWNEWIAGSWFADWAGYTGMLGVSCPNGGFYFVDEYNQEYSRDLEPMKGGYTDNYYFQLVGQNRQRKGARTLPQASAPITINLAGDFSDWTNVAPAFFDVPADTTPRSNLTSVAGLPAYTNYTGRNDFTLLKLARDQTYLYFYAECRADISPQTGTNWMVLFLDTDQQRGTGWEGYDYCVNLGPRTAGTTTLSRNLTTTNAWSWTPVQSDLAYRVTGRKLMLRIPRADLGLTTDPFTIDFHWADNFQVSGDISDWGVNGDSAPDRRFNYRYTTRLQQPRVLLQDDFESGKLPAWGESWAAGSRWTITTTTGYSGTASALCNPANGVGNTALLARFDTTNLDSLRVSFRFKLQNVADAQNLFLQYLTTAGWVTVREIGRDEYYPAGQKWGYDERQNVWMQLADARLNSGTNAAFFHSNFGFRIEAAGLSTSSQTIWIDDVLVTAVGPPVNQPPVLSPVPNQTLIAGQTLTVTNAAADPDPLQTLTFSLLSAPAGASLNAQTGVFTFRPAISQAPLVASVRVRVSDNGVPPLSATQSFWVTVTSPVKPTISLPLWEGNLLRFQVTGDSGPDYLVQASTNLGQAGSWVTILSTNPPALPFQFSDPAGTSFSSRFYRILLGP